MLYKLNGDNSKSRLLPWKPVIFALDLYAFPIWYIESATESAIERIEYVTAVIFNDYLCNKIFMHLLY